MAGPITFAGGTLDRAAGRRTDSAWLEAARTDPRARAVVTGRKGVLLEGTAPAYVAIDGRPGVLLGVDADEAPVWAVEATGDEELSDLRMASGTLAPADAGLLAYAQSMLHWHRVHRFCGVCGAELHAREAGFARACENDHVAHPRTDPVVIMLVVDGDRCLLAARRSGPPGATRRWPGSSSRASRWRPPSRARCGRRRACGSARSATGRRSRGRSRRS